MQIRAAGTMVSFVKTEMLKQRCEMKKLSTILAAIVCLTLVAAATLRAEEASQTVTVTGEVLDMACYLDHGAQGEKHADCAKMCIESGLPVGLKAKDGKTYLLIGEHKPLNKELAPFAAKTITVKGKLIERDGFRAIANAEIVK